MGEAVGGLAARMGFFTPGAACPRRPPGSEFGVHQRNADWPVMEEEAAVGVCLEKEVRWVSSRRMAGLWLVEEPC